MILDSNAEMAWPSGDIPGELDFHHQVSRDTYEVLTGILYDVFEPVRCSKLTIHSLTPSSNIAGRYKIQTPNGSWFARVSSREGSPALEKQIIDHLHQNGVPTNPLLVSGHKFINRERSYYLTIQNLLDGRHFDGSDTDLYNLGLTLSKCHEALRDCPIKEQISRLTETHIKRIFALKDVVEQAFYSEQFAIFKEYQDWIQINYEWVSNAITNWPSLLPYKEEHQCLHGEIHQGNVIYNREDGTAILIDFEESCHVFTTVKWDLAFSVQRFCMKDNPLQNILMSRIAAFSKGYGQTMPDISHTMRCISWYTFARILDLRINHHIITPVNELDKFMQLEQQALTIRGLI